MGLIAQIFKHTPKGESLSSLSLGLSQARRLRETVATTGPSYMLRGWEGSGGALTVFFQRRELYF